MNHGQFLSVKKLKGNGIIQVAARHNHRAILAEYGANADGHIDASRVKDNVVLRGPETALAVSIAAQSLMDAAGVMSLRKDAVRALEVVVGLPIEANINQNSFFDDGVQWAERYFNAPVISAIIHNDEAAPHCHMLILPLVDGRMIGSDLMGYRTKLKDMQATFYEQVGQRYGLSRIASRKPYSAAIRKQAIEMAFNSLQANSGLCDAVLRVLVDACLASPESLMMVLGLEMPKPESKSPKSFVEVMTKPCKPEKPIGFENKKPIGFDAANVPEKEQTLSCVGFGNSDSVDSIGKGPDPGPLIEQIQDDYVREYESNIFAIHWNCETGEYAKPRISASNKSEITESVDTVLRKRAKRTFR